MGTAAEPARIPVQEDPAIQDVYCSAVGKIEQLSGGNYRFIVVAMHTECGKPVYRQVASLIWNAKDLPAAVAATSQVLTGMAFLASDGVLLPMN